MAILLAWLGNTDLRASDAQDSAEQGPILNAADALTFQAVHLLSNHPESKARPYVNWLQRKSGLEVHLHSLPLSSPTNYEDIYRAAVAVIEEVLGSAPKTELTFHLSPGTPAMASVWLLLAKTLYPARLIESSLEQGVKQVKIPFELSAEFSPGVGRQADEALTRLMQGLPPESAAFTAIIHRCAAMKQTLVMARRLAMGDVPVLIQGESGTGKELFARAIHQASARSGRSFVAVNCGAIPQELIESELFGHEKGAFTGAGAARAGYFESAHEGTLFLDEIGDLPLASQVRLLRVLQESEVTRIGATKPKAVNFRVIAATNRVLPAEVQAGRFREDLFYRLAVGVLNLPPLREREGDVGLLIDALLAAINREFSSQHGYQHKNIDVGARNILLRHLWPGNVRELNNILLRAIISAAGERITSEDIAMSLALTVPSKYETVLDRPLEPGLSLPGLLDEVARHYLKRAVAHTRGNKSEAARLLGLSSYQTLSNWLQKYDVR